MYGHTIDATAEGEVEFRDDGGRVVPATFTPVVPASGRDVIDRQNRELAISADTPACGWDGGRVDYDACVYALVVADRLDERN